MPRLAMKDELWLQGRRLQSRRRGNDLVYTHLVEKGNRVGTLQLLPMEPDQVNHGGEIYSCIYSPDGAFVLSAGWDGHLRLWNTSTGSHVSAVCVGSKPLSACAMSPDSRHWLSGSLEGMVTHWDPMTGQQVSMFLAHTRPLSSILFTVDGKQMVTSSWDSALTIWQLGNNHESRILTGHGDIVAGCRITPDGRTLISWSHDRTLRSWDMASARPIHVFKGHRDRVTAASLSPDGGWVVSGSRDCAVKVWDLQTGEQAATTSVGGEVRACFFLLDGQSFVVVDAHGRVTWHTLPTLEEQAEVLTQVPIQCGDLAPSGSQIVLGGTKGRLHFVRVQGFEEQPLIVTPIESRKRTRTMLDRLFGRSRLVAVYSCTCPACRQSFDLEANRLGEPAPCPHCRRNLRMSNRMRVAAEA